MASDTCVECLPFYLDKTISNASKLLTVEEKGLREGHTGLGAKDNILTEVWEQGYNQNYFII